MSNKKLNLTRKNVIAVFGKPNKEKSGEMIYTCSCCREEGHDRHGDNLCINIGKNMITCFNNPEHSKVLRKIYADYISEKRKRCSTENLGKDADSITTGKMAMKNNEQARELLKTFGYKDSTIDRMGICFFNNDWYGIPMLNTKNELLGFEFRDDDEYKFHCKTKGYANDVKNILCIVHQNVEKKNLMVTAGFKDAHLMYQYLEEKGELENYFIATASNGEPSTLRALQANKEYIKDFEKIILCLDRDTAGKDSTKKVAIGLGREVYELPLPFIENEAEKGFKDFTDWYCLAQQENYDKNILKNIRLIPESVLAKEVKYDNDFDKPIFTSYIENLQEGIYPTNLGYYSVHHKKPKKDSNGNIIDKGNSILKRESNFIFNVRRKVVSTNNKFDVESRHKLEIQTVLDGTPTKPVIFEPDLLTKPENIMETLGINGTHFSCLTAEELKTALYREYRSCDKKLHAFENPGFVSLNGKQYWLYTNACVDIDSGEIIYPEKDETLKQGIIKINDNMEIVLNAKRGMKTPLLPQYSFDIHADKYKYLKETAQVYKDIYKEETTTVNIIASSLIRNTLEAYNNSVEPFLIIGNAIMSPFVDIVYKNLKAFPVSFCHGEARSGKSNILELIANIFGYGPDFISGGNDTSNNLLHNMEYYNKTPILFAEVERNLRKNFQENVKCIYDRVPRKIMKNFGEDQNLKAINATIHFASNDLLPTNEQTMTRLIFAEFKQDNFNYKKAIPFNAIRDDLVGLILPELLYYLNHPDYIQTLFNANILKLKLLESKSSTMGIDTRSKKNLAVAMTGMNLLFNMSNLDLEKADDNIKKMLENQTEFLKSYAKLIETKDHFLTFMEILAELFKQDKLNPGHDYKFVKGGMAIYLKSIMPAFRETLKRTSEFNEYIPKETEIKHASEKYGCNPQYVVNLKGKSTRMLYIPAHVEGLDYIMSIILQEDEINKQAGEVI